ncbi:MAG TPA: alpha/beta hydrolase [Pirellulales bacterium]|nr:alpha/beta hydrolase [Pirellulales bacterium]
MTRYNARLHRRAFAQLAATGAATIAFPRFTRAADDAKMKTHTYKKVGDVEIKADVYNAPAGGRRPTVIWIHGGALIVGHRGGLMNRFHDNLIGAGWTVVSIDYRLAPETKLPAILEDVRDACRWVREQGPNLFGADPERIAVTGGSAGGYLTLCSGFLVEPRPKALVPFWGYGDVAGSWYSRPDPFYSKQPAVPKEEAYAAVGNEVITGGEGKNNRGRFYLYCRQQGLWPREVTGHDPDEEPKAFDPFCPVRNVTANYPPTMLIHGDQDTDVPYEQSVLMDKQLTRHGVEHELVTVAGGGHGLSGIDAKIVDATYDRAIEFLRRHLR